MSSQQWLQGQVLDLRAYGESMMKSLTRALVNSTSELGLDFRETTCPTFPDWSHLRRESFHRGAIYTIYKK